MPRFFSSLLVALLGLRAPATSDATPAPRPRRPRRRLSRRPEEEDEQLPVEATDRARSRSITTHRWPGEVVYTVGTRRVVAPGEWTLTFGPPEQRLRPAPAPFLDPAQPAVLASELEALLTMRVPGARLTVAGVDANGWSRLEVRAPSQPETVVQLDRAGVAAVFGASEQSLRVELRALVP